MYKQIIDSRNENNIIFLRCYCGDEIISIYYYPLTTTCPEIIALDYYGIIESKKLQKYRHYSFNRDTFQIFLKSLEECAVEEFSYKRNIQHSHLILSIDRTDKNFIKIGLHTKRKNSKKSLKIWDILIRHQELKSFIFSLKCIRNNIFKEGN